MKRAALALGIVGVLSGCVWGQTRPRDCTNFAMSAGPGEIERMVIAAGAATVEVTHVLCSSKLERLAGLDPARAEVGWCGSIKQTLPADARAIAASSAAQCREAIRRQATYAWWDAAVAGHSVHVSGRQVSVDSRALPPAVRP